MNNPSLAFLVGALASILSGPAIIRFLTGLKVCQTVRDDVPEGHKKKQGTPTMGGVIIFIGMFLGILVALLCAPISSRMKAPVCSVVVMTLAFAAIGFIDDYLIVVRGKNLGLKARQKLLGQFIVAIAFVAFMSLRYGAGFTKINIPGNISFDLGWVYYLLAVLFVVGMSNAVNLADGLDGLVGGLTVIVGVALGLIVASANPGLTSLAWALAGGCLGFLWHNSYPAKVFMGDTGSLAIGAAIAGIAIAGKQEFVAIPLCAVFVIEALSVIIQVISFKTTGKRIFKMSPIHHHFELCGWAEQKIVIRFWIVQGLVVLLMLSWVR